MFTFEKIFDAFNILILQIMYRCKVSLISGLIITLSIDYNIYIIKKVET